MNVNEIVILILLVFMLIVMGWFIWEALKSSKPTMDYCAEHGHNHKLNMFCPTCKACLINHAAFVAATSHTRAYYKCHCGDTIFLKKE